MRYWILVLFLSFGLSSHGQSDIRSIWRNSTKVKVDVLGFADQFPSVMFGVEYPLRDSTFAIEHELGPIFPSGTTSSTFDKATGFKTSHAFLMYSEKRDYVFGAGVFFRQLNLSGDITVCAASNDDGSGGCAFFQLFDEEPVHLQRIAPFLRLRRMLYARNNVTLSFGFDIGRHFQWITNDAFKEDNLILQTRLFGQDLNRDSGVFFRFHTHFVVRL